MGGSAADTVMGRSAADTVMGGSAADTVMGGSAVDTVMGRNLLLTLFWGDLLLEGHRLCNTLVWGQQFCTTCVALQLLPNYSSHHPNLSKPEGSCSFATAAGSH